MSAHRPMSLGSPTVVAAVTATTAAKAFGNTNAEFVNIWNPGSNDAFVNSGNSTISIIFPTTGAGQNGTIIPGGFVTTYKKNNSSDTHLATICGAGLTTTLYIQSGEGL